MRWAGFLAHVTGCTVQAVTAWQPLAAYGWGGFDWTVAADDWNPAQDAEKCLVDAVTAAFGEQHPPALEMTAQQGSAAKVLLEVASDARMLVVGSRGHGGFAGLLLGSVSAACAEHATVPVLVVHGDTHPPPESSTRLGSRT